MMALNRLRVTFAVAIWMFVSAAAPYNGAAQLYEIGKYLEAASLAEKVGTASSLALAARATLAHAIYVADSSSRTTEVQKGEALARKALALDPGQAEAHLQLAIALYQQARVMTPITAYFQGYVGEARGNLDAALRIDADNPWVHSLLGSWHFEVVRLAGPILAQTLFDANLADGRTAFARANTLMPNRIALQYTFARALLLNDPEANRTKAVHALEAALAAKPMDHLDGMVAARARAVLDAVESGSLANLRRTLDPDEGRNEGDELIGVGVD